MANLRITKLARRIAASAAAVAMLADAGVSPILSGPVSALAKTDEKVIALDANGGEFPQGSRAVATLDDEGKIVSLPSGTPYRKGWEFKGWVTTEVEEKVQYAVERDEETGEEKAYFWKITPDPKSASFVKEGDKVEGADKLYALYTPTIVSYSMYPCGWMGNYGALKVSREYGLPFDGKVIGWNWKWSTDDNRHEVLTPVYWADHQFDGWFTAPEGGTQVIDEETPITSDTLQDGKVYLHWHKTDEGAAGAKNQSDWMKNDNIYNYVSTITKIYPDSVQVYTEDGKETKSVNPCEAKAIKIHLNINGFGQSSTWRHVKWSIDDESVASISSDGTKEAVLTPKKAGTVNVTAELTDDISAELERYCGSRDAKIDGRSVTLPVTFDSHEKTFKSYTITKNKGGQEKYDYCQVCGKKYNVEQILSETSGQNPETEANTNLNESTSQGNGATKVESDPVSSNPAKEEKQKEPASVTPEQAQEDKQTKPVPAASEPAKEEKQKESSPAVTESAKEEKKAESSPAATKPAEEEKKQAPASAVSKSVKEEQKKESVPAAAEPVKEEKKVESAPVTSEPVQEEKQTKPAPVNSEPVKEEKQKESAPALSKPAEEEKQKESIPAATKPANEEKKVESSPAASETVKEEKKEEAAPDKAASTPAKAEPKSEPEVQPGIQEPEIFVDIPDEPVLSKVVLNESKGTDNKGNEQTIITYEDNHTATKIETKQAVSSYKESQKAEFAGAEIEVKDSADGQVNVEMKSIPVSQSATYPIALSAPEGSKTNVSIPVENGNWGTVALLVGEDGKAHQIDASYFDGKGHIIVPVSGNMKVVLQNRARSFADVTGNINEYPANNIAFLSARGIMSGKGSNGASFDPTGDLTRGQLALMLYRKAGQPEEFNKSAAPAGVAEDEYYANAAKWAVATGLMGRGGSAFNGKKAITREQLALILYRQSGQSQVETASLTDYNDFGLISSTDAQKAISWAMKQNIMGNNTRDLKPQENTMRQDVAAMVARWIQPAIASEK